MAVFYLLNIVSVVIYLTHSFSVSETEIQNMTSYFVDVLSGKDSDVFRQLLNQETLIRMSLVKNVHSIMQDMVDLKQEMVDVQNTMSTEINQEITKLKQEVQHSKIEIKRLSDENTKLKKQLVLVNNTFENIEKNATQMKTDSDEFEQRVGENAASFQQNISGILSDIKTEVRYMSYNLLNLNDEFVDMKEDIPKLFGENNRSILQWVNITFEQLTEDIADTNEKQKYLKTSLSEVETFQVNNITVRQDYMTTMMNEMKVNVQQYLQDQLKMSSTVKSLQLSRLKKEVGFTAGITSENSGWSGSTLVFPKILYNEGGGYSSSNGIFTSPTNGTFMFYVTIQSYSNSVYVDIVLNGESKVRTMSYSGEAYKTGTNMVILRLQRGDKVWVKRYSGKGYYAPYDVPLVTFSGFIIF